MVVHYGNYADDCMEAVMPAKITKTSPFTNITRTMQFERYDQDEFDSRLLAWRRGEKLIQEAFPELSANAREFIKNGITTEEWDKYMGGDD
jgi:uncharacterized ubiquitin-like protein YukD